MGRKEKMVALVAEQQRSGLTQARFCAEHGIALATFQYWRKKFNDQARSGSALPVRFVPLRVEPERSIGLEIVFPNGVKVNGFGSDTDLVVRVAQSWR